MVRRYVQRVYKLILPLHEELNMSVKRNNQKPQPIQKTILPTTPTPPDTPEPVVNVEESVEVLTEELPLVAEPAVELTFIEKLCKKYRVDALPPTVTGTNLSMSQYCEAMRGNKPMDNKTGSDNQVQLFYTFITALDISDVSEANMALDIILHYISENIKDCFSERLAYRFFDTLYIDSRKRKLFERLLNIFIGISDPSKRRGFIMRLDTNAIVDMMLSDYSKRNFLTFISA